MAITAVDKMKINKYLKEHSFGDINYLALYGVVGKKNKVSDVIFLEYFTECVVKEFGDSEKIPENHLSKILSILDVCLDFVHEDGTDVNEVVLDKIRNFKEFYNEYLNRTGLAFDDEFYNNSIVPVVDKVNKLYPSDINNESVSKYINKISELEELIKELKKEVKETTKLYEVSQKSNDNKSEKIDSLCLEISSLERSIISKEKEVNGLNDIVDQLNQKIEELEDSLTLVKEENALLGNFKEKYLELSDKVQELRKTIKETNKQKKLENKHVKISALMYEQMLLGRVTIDDLIKYVNEQGIDTDKEEVSSVLSKMKKIINVDSSFFSVMPTYKVVAPKIDEDGTFSLDVPRGCRYYDIMLVSDVHIKNFDKELLTRFDLLNEYCAKNGINLILNIGDFYDGFIQSFDHENAIKSYKMVEESVSKIPKADGIYHAILGGNHEKNMSRYGVDPIGFLTKERDDFINLGYTHSTVSLDSSSKVLGKFDIHHPNGFEFSKDVDNHDVDINRAINYLQDMYSRQERSRNDSYIDIFGHMHRSQFNYPGSYCYLAPYSTGNASHLRIYFNEDKDIKCMVFMPLYSNGNHLVKRDELVYQKVMHK